jgi:tetratricopeptide (TPR) repeat protein
VLCLNCHQEKYGGTKLTEHTFHLPDSPGSRCYECHMGETLERLMMHRKDHSLDNPIPENTIRYGIPNACNQSRCHGDRTPEWAARTLDQWYGGEKRKRLLYASEAMWLAKTRDPRAIPLLVRMTGDVNIRLNVRASAARILGRQFGEGALEAVPALVLQLSAEQPLIRMASAEALGSIHDRRAVGPLTRLLTDSARVVRVTAAAALLNLNVLEIEGEAGVALRQAKAEYVQMLRNWPNVPEFRVNLASYYLLHAQPEEALAESKVALQLNPDMPGAYYSLGRSYVAMRRWSDALAAWKKLREVKPDFPNLERLIAATEQQIK